MFPVFAEVFEAGVQRHVPAIWSSIVGGEGYAVRYKQPCSSSSLVGLYFSPFFACID